jgi:hypothetical protein
LSSLWLSRGNPQQCTCLFSVGFPLSGPQVWTCTSCSLFTPDTPVPVRRKRPRPNRPSVDNAIRASWRPRNGVQFRESKRGQILGARQECEVRKNPREPQ